MGSMAPFYACVEKMYGKIKFPITDYIFLFLRTEYSW